MTNLKKILSLLVASALVLTGCALKPVAIKAELEEPKEEKSAEQTEAKEEPKAEENSAKEEPKEDADKEKVQQKSCDEVKAVSKPADK